jgi:apolipoprotein N-acyltransferase
VSAVRALLADAAAALALGALAALAQPGIELFPLGIAALIGFAFLVARRARFLNAAVSGLAFGAALFCAIMLGAASWGANVPLALTSCGALCVGLPLGLWIRSSARRLASWALFVATAAIWALSMDLADALGFPLNWEAANMVAAWPFLLASARWVGANTLSGILIAGAVVAGVELAQGAKQGKERWFAAAKPLAFAFGLLLALGAIARLSAPAAKGSLEAGVPQMDVPSAFFVTRQAIPEASDEFEAAFAAQLKALRGVDLIALTEAYDGRFALEVPLARARFQSYARLERQALLLTSYLVAPDGGGYNAVAGISPNGDLVGIHRKVQLAPFGESDLKRGAAFKALALWPELKVGAMICQESVALDAARALAQDGANLLVATTSDSSFGSSLLVFGHLAMTRVRAIESGRDILWASASGPSGLINRWGDFRSGAPLRSAEAARMRAELFDETTLFLHTIWLWPLLRVAALTLLSFRLVAAPPLTPPASRGSIWRATLGFAGALMLAALVSVGAPGLVEWRHGISARAGSAIAELWDKPPPLTRSPSYERFRTTPERSAEGALAFYLDFYGPSRSAAQVNLGRDAVGLVELLRYLRDVAHFPGRRIELQWQRLPRAATLVRRRDGEYAVLTANGVGVASLFSPSQATPLMLHTNELERLLEPVGILPAGAADTAPYEH